MVDFNKTFVHTITNVSFGNLSQAALNEYFKDGRIFSHLIEPWLAENYPLKYIPGCRGYDLLDRVDQTIQFDEKTFTKYGCDFMQSSMIGTGRTFNQAKFDEKVKNMNYIIVSNINFPEIKVKFSKGEDLVKMYPKGSIPSKDHDSFFTD